MALRRFYKWARDANVRVEDITRTDIVAFCSALHALGLAPATRAVILVMVRNYLRFLARCGRLQNDPRDLVAAADFPPLPERLPRVLGPDLDHELAKVLFNSDRPLWLGLYVMRWTGMRVSELRHLPCDCTREDGRGNQFLKVPLGKLNKERLVPIDEQTLGAIKRLHSLRPNQGPWLLVSRSLPHAPYSRQSIGRALEKAVRLCTARDPDPVCCHRLRHTYAATMLDAGLTVGALRQILGHRDVNMTLRYAALTLDSLAQQHAAAFKKVMAKHHHALPRGLCGDPSRAVVAADVLIRTLKRNAQVHPGTTKLRAQRLLRRLHRIAGELEELGL
jgi:site-specific recombinase XerD